MFQAADSFLRQAEKVLQSDRYQRAEAKTVAESASSEFRDATYIAMDRCSSERTVFRALGGMIHVQSAGDSRCRSIRNPLKF
jgi:hypothetical protein